MLDTHNIAAPLRSPDTVMQLARLGSIHQCRLSFMRTLMRRMKNENWTFERPVFDFDKKGIGVAVYSAHGPQRTYSLVCFGHDLPDEQRSDRVIAHAWDSTFTLFDGIPTQADIERLSQNVPKQEAGRVSSKELSVSRANRSVRMFYHVVNRLAAGQQPDHEMVLKIGYLMRTTAVYGSGKLGAADREELAGPFQAEMLSVYLIRAYTLDLVEEMARKQAPKTAVAMDPELRRCIGVGNSTGLGMAPFLVNHPTLLNNWIAAREQALARVCGLQVASENEISTFKAMLRRAQLNADQWTSEHPIQAKKITELKSDLQALQDHVAGGALKDSSPWENLYEWAENNLTLEGQEQLVSLMLEPYGELIDNLENVMKSDEASAFFIDGSMSLEQLKSDLEKDYAWALKTDWTEKNNQARVWYVSAEKLEPRIGERFEEPIAPYEQPLAPGRDAQKMYQDIKAWEGEQTVAAFLLNHPEHRHIVRRSQITAKYPYAEIRDNTISKDLLPFDMLRFKLGFFGVTHFDPRSDRWVRVNMYKNAPFPHELANRDADNWGYPTLE